jgi:signal transduction histidine kinase
LSFLANGGSEVGCTTSPVTGDQQSLLPPCYRPRAMLGPVKQLERGHSTDRGWPNSDVGDSGAPMPAGPGRDADADSATPTGMAGPFVKVARRLAGRGVLRRTVRMRLALAYGALFLVCGAALLAVSFLFVARFPVDASVHLISPNGHAIVSSRMPKSSAPGASGSQVVHNLPAGAGSAAQAALSAQHSADLHSLLVWFAAALGVMAVISVLVGWLMAGRVLRPLRKITATTRHISEQNLHQRLDLVGPSDEITDLAGTIDGLLARLEGAFDAQRAFVANASHELRTPLAMMRTSLDVAEAKSPPISKDALVLSAKVREGLDQAERLVESFLVLARAERGAMDDLTAVSLSRVTADALDTRADPAAAANVTLQRSLDDAEIDGSRTLISRLAANLIDNAIRYNQPGGSVQATTLAEGLYAELIVENSGPVLDPAEVDQLGRPCRRAGTERTSSDGGVGLGLSIVAAIAAAHHGSVEIETRPEGGLRVTVSLPRLLSSDPDRELA